MARFMRLDVINAILNIGVVPLFYNGDIDTAVEITSSLRRGGARVVEFTNRGEMAYPVFTELIKRFAKSDPDLILGVGSVMDAPTAALYLASGANFIVGPSHNPEISRLCNRRKIAYLPGCATETEIAQAEEMGAEICKIFPGEAVGGPGFISAVMGPCPWHRLLPTGGVDATEAGVSAWIKAGAAAIGMGSKLVTAEAVKERDFDAISSRTAQTIAWIKKARGVPLFLGIDYPGFYPRKAGAAEIAAWYEKMLGLEKNERKSSFTLSSAGTGHIEVMKNTDDARLNITIRVSNFEEAVAALKEKGVALKKAIIKPESKSICLQDPDPDGNRIYLLWLAD